MAPSTLRKAIGAVKDQTSIGIAKVASNTAPELEVAVVKATSHDDDPASEKHIREILHLSSSHGYVSACVVFVSKRLGKTRDWIVALKCLMLVHRLFNDGDHLFQHEFTYATRRGTRLLNLSDFRDEAHSNSWDHSAFVRAYAMYLDQRLELMAYEREQRSDLIKKLGVRDYDYMNMYRFHKSSSGIRRSRSSGDVRDSTQEMIAATPPLREMEPGRIFGKMDHLQRLLDRFLSCRPTGLAKNERMVLVALYYTVKDSFNLYADICEVLAVLLDKFFDMEYQDCVKAFDFYATSAKQIDELVGFYNWCKGIGVARSSEFPEIQKVSSKLLETLDEFVRDRANATKSPVRKVEKEVEEPAEPEIIALPPPENYSPPPPPPPPLPPQPELEPAKIAIQETADLLDLRDEGVSADDQGNKFALALFAGPARANGVSPEVTSAWQNPAAESGKADWELALVESASHLSQQKASLGGGLDPLLLNGMYDQGMVRQNVSMAHLSGGSASSVALPEKSKTPVLALPAPDGGAMEIVGGDPFAASLSIPPPSYVQMADMEKKQHLLVQEQIVWQQYSANGMQGQASFAKISTGGYYAHGVQPIVPYAVNGYHYSPY
ncbi:hypothetical protein ABFS82_01G004000 [Erythranthe guttata]|uniref:ENTH domain-containing protein n=1 Tax=Erythranthe guttata TaxID=4155 RepID=A0A022PV33_ERYGU|nr:PREDICTED: putative clathrin assembly protein At2g25430 [Erythranthe guttata]EYU20257.1 hypothetical protein MIMGU_mgv1a003119mg [Erythranthe guttata]|eukprot:XP_012857797.1 PREDICTED: putative clathrin assembly protein At2g25430 [Erythranthe guttata]